MTATLPTSYDDIPYPSYSFPQSHPDRAAVIATLLGLTPPPVERCHILELGCASGSNLIPMAEELPHSTFVGIDLSRRQIDDGRRAVAELGLTNIELRCQSILDSARGAESFDYIVCHGVFSWVPPEVQEGILAVCRQCLQPAGVAYVSYNTLPGWHMRGMIRDMMLYHGRRFADPHQQIAQARGLLDFLVASIPMEENPYGQYLRSELQSIRQQPDGYLRHDHLEDENHSIYFHQFVERAAAHQLRYLADVTLSSMDNRNLAPQVSAALEQVSLDLLQMEQYMDFLRNRTFRESLLCHARHTPTYHLGPQDLTAFFVASSLQPVSPPDLQSDGRADFRAPSGATAYCHLPIVKAALLVLGEAWPVFLPFPELCMLARARAGAGPEAHEEVRQALLRFCTIAPDLVEFRLRPLAVTTRPGRQPRARPLARWQARTGRPIVNLRHEGVAVDEFGRQLLPWLDGQHARPAVVQELAALVTSGQWHLRQDGEPVTNAHRVETVVLRTLEKQLQKLAGQALLLA